MATLILYWTGSGNTKLIAEALYQGVISTGESAEIKMVTEITPSFVSKFSKFALGCPSMGVEQLEQFEFNPFYLSIQEFLAGKKVVLFGSYGWGDGEWMRNWEKDVANAGAKLIAPGLAIHETPSRDDLDLAHKLGVNLAKA